MFGPGAERSCPDMPAFRPVGCCVYLTPEDPRLFAFWRFRQARSVSFFEIHNLNACVTVGLHLRRCTLPLQCEDAAHRRVGFASDPHAVDFAPFGLHQRVQHTRSTAGNTLHARHGRQTVVDRHHVACN